MDKPLHYIGGWSHNGGIIVSTKEERETLSMDEKRLKEIEARAARTDIPYLVQSVWEQHAVAVEFARLVLDLWMTLPADYKLQLSMRDHNGDCQGRP